MPSKQEYEVACTKYAANLALKLEGKTVLAPEPELDESAMEEDGDGEEGRETLVIFSWT